MYKVNINEFTDGINNLLKQIKGKRYKAVAGIPRGGCIVAYAMSINSDLELVDINDINSFQKTEEILIVDDIADSGKTRAQYKNFDFASLCASKEFIMHPWKWFNEKNTLMNNYHAIPVNEWVHFFWEGDEKKDIESTVVRQLEFIGENPNRSGIIETPKRVVKSWDEIYSGYKQDPKDLVKTFGIENDGTFRYDEIVLLKDIQLYSMCEHHMLPFVGKAHIAYIPSDKVIGISKLARILDCFGRRLQIQERIGDQVTDFLMKELKPIGAACIIEAQHFCMRMRGCNKQESTMVTSSLKGAFKDKPEARFELMELIRK